MRAEIRCGGQKAECGACGIELAPGRYEVVPRTKSVMLPLRHLGSWTVFFPLPRRGKRGKSIQKLVLGFSKGTSPTDLNDVTYGLPCDIMGFADTT